MIVVITSNTGTSSAVNLANHSWETSPIAGENSMVSLVLDNGKEFTLPVAKYDEIIEKLKEENGFLVV